MIWAHRKAADSVAFGTDLLLDHPVERIELANRRVWLRGIDYRGFDKLILGTGAVSVRRSPVWPFPGFSCSGGWPTPSRSTTI